jgi:hypothetical protein
MRSGKDAAALMDTLSTTEKNAVLKWIANDKLAPTAILATSQGATQ